MRKVYLIKETGLPRDISGSSHFGDLVVCLRKEDDNLSPGMLLNRLRSSLRDFGEGDYILYAGGEWSLALAAGIVLREMNVKTVDLLLWKRVVDRTAERSHAYIPTRIVL